MIVDPNYNCVVTLANGKEEFLFADRLHNENLDHWKGWKCAAGYNYVSIKPNFDVYGSHCENDYLGNLNDEFQILTEHTVCKKDRCIACTADLMVDKFSPKSLTNQT
jgi:hypothetical protein